MKIIVGVFHNLDIELLSHKNLFHHIGYKFLQRTLKFKKCEKKKFFASKGEAPGIRGDLTSNTEEQRVKQLLKRNFRSSDVSHIS